MFVRTPSGRKRLNVLGALDYVTKELISISNTEYINSETVCQLLHKLRDRYADLPITLVLDNARYQRCRLVQDLAKTLNIELMFLPSYSPNLNLIERLWKLVKHRTLNGKYYATFDEFSGAILTCLNNLNTTYKDDIQSLITRNFQLFDKRTFLAA
jgi:transposase